MICTLSTFATDYFVATVANGGSNANTGLAGQPWATLAYACSQVSAGSHTINVGVGTFTENTAMSLATGVSIMGADSSTTTVTTFYNNGSPTSHTAALIILSSGTVNTNGSQSISNIKFNGNGVCNLAISVNNRSNVTINKCAFDGFVRAAIVFISPINTETYGELPYSIGNTISNIRMTNCATYNSYPQGITIQGQDQFVLSGCKLVDNRNGSSGADLINSKANKRWYIHHNVFRKEPKVSGVWGFAFEIRWNYGECRFEDNDVQGIADFCWNYVQGYAYSILVQNNFFGFDVLKAGYNDGIQFEAYTSKIIVRYNYIKNVSTGITWVPADLAGGGIANDNLIHNNLLTNIGQTTTPAPGNYSVGIGFYTSSITTAETRRLYIYNNTIEGGTYSRDGIWFGRVSQYHQLYVRNNIVKDFINSPLHCELGAGKVAGTDLNIDSLYIQNNNFFGNGNTNLQLYTGITPSNPHVDNNITTNPLFVGGGNYRLQSTSLAINAGLNVGLTTDITGYPVSGNPDIGAYKYYAASPSGKVGTFNDKVGTYNNKVVQY